MQLRNILKPNRLLIAILAMQFLGYFLYVIGVIKSFRITFVSTSLFGFVCILMYFLIQIVIMSGTETRKSGTSKIQCVKKKKVKRIAIIYLLISFSGFLGLTANLIGSYSIGQLLYMVLRNRQIDLLVYGSGNTILVNFCIVSLMLLSLIIEWKDKKTVILWAINLAFLIIYASFLSSRILIIQGVIFCALIFTRRFFYKKKIGWKAILLVFCMVIFLVITSGYRDYDQMGYRYTDSKVEWGISRLADYLISVTNTSLEIGSYTSGNPSSFPQGTLEILTIFSESSAGDSSNYHWRAEVSAPEYTNIGAFAQVYSDWKLLFVIPTIIIALASLSAWRSYDKGYFWGYMVWPLFLYNTLEIWRINYLGTATAEVLLIIIVFTCFICRKNFVYLEETPNGSKL